MSSEINVSAEAIASRFDDQWADRTPVAYEGADFDPPKDAPWVRFDIVWGDGFIETMGGTGRGKNRLVGIAQAIVFVPRGQGTGELEELADTVRDAFNRIEVASVRFDAPSGPKPSGERAPEWLSRLVDCPFEVEETI